MPIATEGSATLLTTLASQAQRGGFQNSPVPHGPGPFLRFHCVQFHRSVSGDFATTHTIRRLK